MILGGVYAENYGKNEKIIIRGMVIDGIMWIAVEWLLNPFLNQL